MACRLAGAIDLHLHGSPDVRPRYADDLTLAREAAAAGMRAILLKCHAFPTADRAALIDPLVEGTHVFGGVVLNHAVGGINPAAAGAALEIGARCVWMPTHDAAHHNQHVGVPGGLRAVDRSGRLISDARRVVDLAARHGAILATGHLSPEESAAIVGYAGRIGHSKVLITHPDSALVEMTVEQQMELAGAGAIMERCYVDTTEKPGRITMDELAARILTVGARSSILTTDLGQPHNPPPVTGFELFLGQLAQAGIDRPALRLMSATNPARLLGLEEQDD